MLVAQPQDEVAELLDLLVVEPAGGLVEQEQRGSATSARAISTRFWIPYGSAAAEASARSARPTSSSVSSASRLPRPPAEGVRADEHVLEHGHRAEQVDVLERARDPALDDAVGGVRSSDVAVELELARVGVVEPRDDVERRRLAGAVRADQTGDRARAATSNDTRRGRRCRRSGA